MNIKEVKKAIRVGEIRVGNKKYTGSKYVYYDYALELLYDQEFNNDLKRKELSIVYFFVVNGIIYKIGQSSGKNGIEGCIGFYLKSGQDDPGMNRFAINWLIREKLIENKKVEIYMLFQIGFKMKVSGLFTSKEVFAVTPSKAMEQNCIDQYKGEEKKYPNWNYQEDGTPLPEDITRAFGQYKIDRKDK